jgi:hypothetical protein
LVLADWRRESSARAGFEDHHSYLPEEESIGLSHPVLCRMFLADHYRRRLPPQTPRVEAVSHHRQGIWRIGHRAMSLREILNAMWLFGKVAQEPHISPAICPTVFGLNYLI